jgi:hypothetical protein
MDPSDFKIKKSTFISNYKDSENKATFMEWHLVLLDDKTTTHEAIFLCHILVRNKHCQSNSLNAGLLNKNLKVRPNETFSRVRMSPK